MNIKDTINFKTLRERGPNAIDVKDDEVVQVISKGTGIKVVLTQEYFLSLLAAYNDILRRSGHRPEKNIEIEERLNSFEKKLSKVIKETAQDQEKHDKWRAGRKMAGNY